jgi:hypothetical protein
MGAGCEGLGGRGVGQGLGARESSRGERERAGWAGRAEECCGNARTGPRCVGMLDRRVLAR